MPVIDHWWQTETGWPISHNPVGLGLLPVKYGSPGVPMPGYDVRVLDDAGHEVAAGTLGNVVVKLPLPPGCLPTLWNADERFRQRLSRRVPRLLQDRRCRLHRRRRLSVHHGAHRRHHQRRRPPPVDRRHGGGASPSTPTSPNAPSSASPTRMKGQVPCGFVVLNSGVDRDTTPIEKEVIGLVRDRIGPVAAFKTGGHHQAPAQDALGQDPARHHAEDRRPRGLEDAGHHRRSRDPRRDNGSAPGKGRRHVSSRPGIALPQCKVQPAPKAHVGTIPCFETRSSGSGTPFP